MSSGLLSDSERSSLYTLTISLKDGSSVANGSVLAPGTQINALVAKNTGASDPAILDVSLTKQDSPSSTAALRFASSAVDSSKIKSVATLAQKSVASIDGKLEGFSVPADQDSGLYQLAIAISGPDGSLLQQETASVFIGSVQPLIDSVTIFPPSVEPSASVLLGLSVSWAAIAPPDASVAPKKGASDPWIKWSRDGTVFAEGLQSDGFAKVVWTAPRIEGAYSIRAEVFPTAPTKGGTFAFKAFASQDLRVMVIATPGGSGNDFADPLSFYSLLKFDGNFDDLGTRLRSAPPVAIGSPSLDTYSSGFGYRFGTQKGVTIPGLMPPSSSGKLGAFAVLVRFAPDQSDGTIVKFASADASYSLVLGLKDGKPYVESKIAGNAQRSIASSSVPAGAITLEAIFMPDGDNLSVSWRAEGERIEAPPLPMPPSPPAGSATLGDTLSLPGVYDGFGLMVPLASSAFPSPAYRLAMRRQWKSSLIIAEGFEDGVLPSSSSATGSVKLFDRGLELETGAALALSPAFGNGGDVVVEAGFEGDGFSCLLDFSSAGGEEAFSVRGTGDVLDATGAAIGSIPATALGLRFSLEQRDGKLKLVGAGGTPVLAIPGSVKRFVLSLRQDGKRPAVFNRILVRSASSATNS
jgi:hypothetical protein